MFAPKKLFGWLGVGIVALSLTACGSTQPTYDVLHDESVPSTAARGIAQIDPEFQELIDALQMNPEKFVSVRNDEFRLQMMAQGVCRIDSGSPNMFASSLSTATFNRMVVSVGQLSGTKSPSDLVINDTMSAFKQRVDEYKAMKHCGR